MDQTRDGMCAQSEVEDGTGFWQRSTVLCIFGQHIPWAITTLRSFSSCKARISKCKVGLPNPLPTLKI